MLETRPSVPKYDKCKESVKIDNAELPTDFSSSHFTAIVSRGFLVYVTIIFLML